jgi:hypothetical protein
MENKDANNASGVNNKFVFKMIEVTISKENCCRMHEIIREMQRLGALNKLDAEMLLVSCSML